jgi:hypothetical protein
VNIGVSISEKSKLLGLQLFYEDISFSDIVTTVKIETVRLPSNHQSAITDYRSLITDYYPPTPNR